MNEYDGMSRDPTRDLRQFPSHQSDVDDEGIPPEAMAAIRRMTSDLSSGFQCLICPMTFRQLFSLVQHQQRHFVEDKLIEKSKAHGEDAPKKVFLEEIKEVAAWAGGIDETSSEIRPHRCPNCNKTYSYSYYLESHLKKCKAKKDSKAAAFCEVCGLQFGSRTTLIRHQIEKHGIRPESGPGNDAGKLPCEYCDIIRRYFFARSSYSDGSWG